jgi:hypothetical protein
MRGKHAKVAPVECVGGPLYRRKKSSALKIFLVVSLYGVHCDKLFPDFLRKFYRRNGEKI